MPFALDNVAHPNLTRSEIDFLNSFDSGVWSCTFGMAVFTADGKRLAPNQGGSYDPKAVLKQLERALAEFQPESVSATLDEDREAASRLRPPDGGLALYVTWKVLDKSTCPGTLGSDRLWVRRDEAEALLRGSFPASLTARMVRDHLRYVMSRDVAGFDPVLRGGRTEGSFAVMDPDHRADYLGFVEAKKDKICRFDLLVKGWARRVSDCGFSVDLGAIPAGKLVPVALLFELADPAEGLAQVVPSQVDRGTTIYPDVPNPRKAGKYPFPLPLGTQGENLSYYR